jgi:hypothetical protein
MDAIIACIRTRLYKPDAYTTMNQYGMEQCGHVDDLKPLVETMRTLVPRAVITCNYTKGEPRWCCFAIPDEEGFYWQASDYGLVKCDDSGGCWTHA